MDVVKSKTEGQAPDVRPQRLFFALWPPDPVREALHRAARQHLAGLRGARLMHPENLHVTLHFLGGVERGQRDCVERLADAVSGRPFTLTFGRLGHWPRPKVVHAAPDQLPEDLLVLVARLGMALPDCGLSAETRPYRAHVTLARNVRRRLREQVIEPVVWEVDGFVLVESVSNERGVEYRVLRRWTLDG